LAAQRIENLHLNGLISNLCVVAARTNPDSPHAIGLFVVEEGMEGFKRGRKLKKLGLHSQDTAELFFQDVKVPIANVLGEPTQGFRNLMLNLAEERLSGAVGYVTRAERAFEVTLAYITDRKAFGRLIGTFQNSRFKMAEMRARIDACWALVDHCVMEHVERKLAAETAAAAKLFSSESKVGWSTNACNCTAAPAIWTNTNLPPVCRRSYQPHLRGTSEIMKEIIGRSLGLDERKRFEVSGLLASGCGRFNLSVATKLKN